MTGDWQAIGQNERQHFSQNFEVAHVSDLHFGRTEPLRVRALAEALVHSPPDLLVVTGDLTQRARRSQFRQARRFLDDIPCPKLVVPGNHDIAPFFRPLARLFYPRRRYQRFLGDIELVQRDGLIAIGIDSVSRWRAKEGSLTRGQLADVRRVLADLPRGFRILASHHPLIHPERGVRHRVPERLVDLLNELQIDVALSGHLHESWAGPRCHCSSHDGRLNTLFVQASTATSTRLRGHRNAYNRLEIGDGGVTLRVETFDGFGFTTTDTRRYVAGTEQRPAEPALIGFRNSDWEGSYRPDTGGATS
ncbi:MAG: metallophosphoesterase [Polyangiaceae bacterium]|nr:metallophosphoesterase [Polyangiaceae bacterium]